MTLSQPTRLQRLLTKHEWLPLLTAPQGKDFVLEMTGAATSMHLLEKVRRAMERLSETMISSCYINDAGFRDLAELHKAGTREILAQSVISTVQPSLQSETSKRDRKHKPRRVRANSHGRLLRLS